MMVPTHHPIIAIIHGETISFGGNTIDGKRQMNYDGDKESIRSWWSYKKIPQVQLLA